MSEQEAPYVVMESRLYYDTLGRTAARAVIVTGQVPEDFVEFEIHAKIKIRRPLPGADGSVAYKEDEFPVSIPVPGVRTKGDRVAESLAKVFAKYDELVAAEQVARQEELDQHVKMFAAMQQQAEEKRIKEAVHNPELPERHLDKNGNEVAAPGKIIQP